MCVCVCVCVIQGGSKYMLPLFYQLINIRNKKMCFVRKLNI